MSRLLQYIEHNEVGRDFVVGDLHGCIDEFEQLFEKIEFDPTHDRMFSVGDLVDRGPDSMACLRLLKEPWFFSVMGNHEDMMLDAVSSNFTHGVALWINNGGDWGVERYEASDPEFFGLVDLVDTLPLGFIIKSHELGNIGVCHAEPPSGWTEECFEKEYQSVIWGRKKIYLPEGQLKKCGVDFSIHGHTINKTIAVRDDIKAFWIDLGCYCVGSLCALQISGADITWPSEHIIRGNSHLK